MYVAFLGSNWTNELFESWDPKNVRVICDLEMKVTIREALKNGGAQEIKI
jgi:hypothetical protein